MTIPNYDQEIEKRYHPENFESEAEAEFNRNTETTKMNRYPKFDGAVGEKGAVTFIKGSVSPSTRPVRIKKSAKRGSAKESRSIQHKKLNK